MKREFSAGGVVLRGEEVAVVTPRKGVLALPKGHPDGEIAGALEELVSHDLLAPASLGYEVRSVGGFG